jgi:hypothetical protein
MSQLSEAISGFRPISLGEMDSVALMNRVDTKYLLSYVDALSILGSLKNDYKILEIANDRQFEYRTIYFDTASKRLLYDHLRGKLNREKVRAREYVGTTSRFFELKLKTNKGRTVKKRIPKTGEMETIQAEESAFLSSISKLDADSLSLALTVNFFRVTLVNLAQKERMTFDFHLTFSSDGGLKTVDDLVIIELKRDAEGALRTLAMDLLKRISARPSSMSKYCLGMILLEKAERYNSYKPKLLNLNKLSTHGDIW